jgi:hypothetical protein
VGQMSPSGMDVYIFLVQGDGSLNRRMQRKLWRRVNSGGSSDTDETSEWELCADHPGPNVIPPYKVFRGPVGLHDDSYARFLDIVKQKKAIRIHRIAAMERHHFYGLKKPFGCSAPDCDAWFEQPEEYTSHAIETKHDKIVRLPEFIESFFAENDKRLERLTEIAGVISHLFSEWWGEYGSEKRVVAQKEYIAQLEHDPLYAQDKPVLAHPHLHAIHRSYDSDY